MFSQRDEQRFSHRGLWQLIGIPLAASTPEQVKASVKRDQKFADDVAILNIALGLEHQAIAAYNLGAESKLLSTDQLKIAISFRNDHRQHRDVLLKYIKRFGGTPVEPKSRYDFGALTSAADILKLAHALETGAAGAYLANAYRLQSTEIINAAVPILVDEVRHTTVFRQLLGLSVTERLKV